MGNFYTSLKLSHLAAWPQTQKGFLIHLPTINFQGRLLLVSGKVNEFRRKNSTQELLQFFFSLASAIDENFINTVDGRNPAPPGMYKTL